jgi:hypothetical protein
MTERVPEDPVREERITWRSSLMHMGPTSVLLPDIFIPKLRIGFDEIAHY